MPRSIGDLCVFEARHVSECFLARIRQHDPVLVAQELVSRNCDIVGAESEEAAGAHYRIGNYLLRQNQVINSSDHLALVVIDLLSEQLPLCADAVDSATYIFLFEDP